MHTLAEGADLLPLLQRRVRLVGIELQFVHLAEEPFDLGEARSLVALHRPLELFLGPRLLFAGRRPEPLGHDADDQRQRFLVLLQSLLRDQLLRPADAEGRVVLPVHDFEPGTPNMGGGAVVFLEKPADALPFRPDVTGRGEEHVILTEGLGRKFHREVSPP